MSPLEFAAMPSNLKIPPGGGAGILNIVAKLKNSYQLAALKETNKSDTFNTRPEKYNHLLIAKIKDT